MLFRSVEAVKEVKADAEIETMTLTELKALAKDKKVKNYSTMKKEELINPLIEIPDEKIANP